MAGNITIVEPKDNFQKVSRFIIENERIDHVTLALYVRILHIGKNWKLHINGLAARFNLSAQVVRRSINLLEKEGYIRREAVRDTKTGQMNGWDYFVYSQPVEEEERTALSKNRNTVKTEIRCEPKDGADRIAVKCKDINKRPDNNKRPKDNKRPEGGRFVRPTVEEVAEYCESRCNNIDPEAFVAFYDSKGWKVGSAPMKDWRAAVITWEKRHKEEAPAANESKTYSIEEYMSKH